MVGDKKAFLIFLFLITATIVNPQQTIKRGVLLKVDVRNDKINYADTIWHWEDFRSKDSYIIDECLNIFSKKEVLYLLTTKSYDHYYLPGMGSTSYQIFNTLLKKYFYVASFGNAVDVIGEPYMNQRGKIIITDNGFWFLGGAFLPSTYFDLNDSTYSFNSRSETGTRLTHILGKIGNDYLIAVRREPRSITYDYYLSDFSSLPTLSANKKIAFKNSKDSYCLPYKIEGLQDSIYIVEYECASLVDFALLSKDTLKTISADVSLPEKRILKNNQMIYTEINSSNNSFDLYTSTFNREKLVFEQKRKLLDSFSSNAVFDSSLISWVSNDSLFVFNFRTNQYVNKYSLNGILIKAKIFLSYPYILLDQILLIMDVKNNSEPIDSFSLFQNYPNPFNPTTTIKYTVPNIGTRHASNLQLVTLKVYDMLGREVTTLVNDYKQPGTYNCEFRIENGKLPSGVYFYKLSAGYFTQTKKMLLLK